MYPQFFLSFGKQILYLLLLLVVLWWSLVLFCADGEAHFNGISKGDDATFGDRVFNRFYFATVTMTTLGYGDVSPKSKTARGIVIAFLLLMFFGFFGIFSQMQLHNVLKSIKAR